VYYGAWHLDRNHHTEASDKVSMGNCRANRLVCEAADRAVQVPGGADGVPAGSGQVRLRLAAAHPGYEQED
jgi:alkylation response protein AidB-like acyl-CoA dehydrogenase